MAALRLPPVVALRHVSQAVPQRRSARSPSQPPLRSLRLAAAHTVQLVHGGKTHTLRVDEDESILEVALDAGIDVPHDCKMGVCMTCPAKLISGEIDQSGGSMLSEDVKEKGFVLLCCGRPLGDCTVKTVDEEELLQFQMQSGAL